MKRIYKCFVWMSISRPGLFPLEIGMVPVSWLSARSSQIRLDRLPREGGMPPESLLKFRDLQRIEIWSEGWNIYHETCSNTNLEIK